MVSVEEMRAVAHYIEREVPGIDTARFTVAPGAILLQVKMLDGRLLWETIDLTDVDPVTAEIAWHAFCDTVHTFVQRHRERRSSRAQA